MPPRAALFLSLSLSVSLCVHVLHIYCPVQVLLTDVDMSAIIIGNLGVDVGGAGRLTAACHYEVVVSGYGIGGGCGERACVANCHYSITPFRTPLPGLLAPGAIVVRDLTIPDARLLSSEVDEPVELALRPQARNGELWLHHDGPRPAEMELLVDVKRVGRGCSSAVVTSA